MEGLRVGAAPSVVVAGSLAGCGYDGDSGVGDYVEAANAICAEMDSRGRPFNDALSGQKDLSGRCGARHHGGNRLGCVRVHQSGHPQPQQRLRQRG